MHVYHVLACSPDGLNGALLERLHLRQERGEVKLALKYDPGPHGFLTRFVQPIDPPFGSGNSRLGRQYSIRVCLGRQRIRGHIIKVSNQDGASCLRIGGTRHDIIITQHEIAIADGRFR